MILIGPDVIATTTNIDRPAVGDYIVVEDTLYSVSSVRENGNQVIVNLDFELLVDDGDLSTTGDNWC